MYMHIVSCSLPTGQHWDIWSGLNDCVSFYCIKVLKYTWFKLQFQENRRLIAPILKSFCNLNVLYIKFSIPVMHNEDVYNMKWNLGISVECNPGYILTSVDFPCGPETSDAGNLIIIHYRWKHLQHRLCVVVTKSAR